MTSRLPAPGEVWWGVMCAKCQGFRPLFLDESAGKKHVTFAATGAVMNLSACTTCGQAGEYPFSELIRRQIPPAK